MRAHVLGNRAVECREALVAGWSGQPYRTYQALVVDDLAHRRLVSHLVSHDRLGREEATVARPPREVSLTSRQGGTEVAALHVHVGDGGVELAHEIHPAGLGRCYHRDRIAVRGQ